VVSFRAATSDDFLAIERFAGLASRLNPARYSEHWGRWGDFGIISETDGQPTGAAWARLFAWNALRDPCGSPDFPVVAIAVDPAFRGRGIGTSLLRDLLADAEKRGYLGLDLSVHRSNLAAMAVYAKVGFKRVDGDSPLWMRATIPRWGDSPQGR
jgi:ribosomal protein S18 acetylase RimI-like enzyme